MSIGLLAAQENCMKSTVGKFELAYGPYKGNYSIVRTDSTQTDFDTILNSKTEYEITWIDDCSYKLRRISGRKLEGFQGFELKELIFQIDTVDENGYGYLLKIADTDILLDTTRFVKVN